MQHIKQTPHPATQIATDEGGYKFLGMPWNFVHDVLYIKTAGTAEFVATGTTERNLLKGLSQLFDSLGQIASIAIGLKALLQSLWTQRVDWDDSLSGELEESYKAPVASLKFAPSIRLRRALFKNQRSTSPECRRELHVFADASLRAYGCIAYSREIGQNPKGKASITFVMAKSRVAPLAGKGTIHRLELMAAVIATRIAKSIRENLSEDIGETFMYLTTRQCWVGSEINQIVGSHPSPTECEKSQFYTFRILGDG